MAVIKGDVTKGAMYYNLYMHMFAHLHCGARFSSVCVDGDRSGVAWALMIGCVQEVTCQSHWAAILNYRERHPVDEPTTANISYYAHKKK